MEQDSKESVVSTDVEQMARDRYDESVQPTDSMRKMEVMKIAQREWLKLHGEKMAWGTDKHQEWITWQKAYVSAAANLTVGNGWTDEDMVAFVDSIPQNQTVETKSYLEEYKSKKLK